MIKLPILICLSLSFVSAIIAQSDPWFSLSQFNQISFNSASAGNEERNVISFIGRRELLGLEDGPRTFYISYDGNINSINSGIGAILYHDKFGIYHTSKLGLLYNYKIKINEHSSLRIGTQLFLIHHLREKYWSYSDSLYKSAISDLKPDFDMSGWYNWKELFIGISLNHVTEPLIVFNGIGSMTILKRELFFYSAYKIHINDKFNLTPSFTFRITRPDLIQYDFGSVLDYDEIMFAGFSYRPGDSFILYSGIKIINKYKILFAYDIILSKLNQFSHGNVEIGIKFLF